MHEHKGCTKDQVWWKCTGQSCACHCIQFCSILFSFILNMLLNSVSLLGNVALVIAELMSMVH